ncbi:MAG: Uma2 family endonuclease [Oscillatoria sp. SIO1A7]|nr:Uma2 family endonuclease [Oscillatoria sp. SIO1A7]
MTVFTVNLNSVMELTDEQFYQLSWHNETLRLERTAAGELIIMPAAGGIASNRNATLTAKLYNWNHRAELGIAFDSSTGFKLKGGAIRSPDASWLTRDRWEAMSPEQRKRFPPLCPDFVVELLSPSDSLSATQEKMQEYLDNGARLGWLINRRTRQVEIYRPGREVEVLENPATLSGETVMPGFVLNLELIW